jgi:chromosome segregation ATPase
MVKTDRKDEMTSPSQTSATRTSLRILEDREQEHRETLLRLQAQIDTKSHDLQELARQIAGHEALTLEIETYGKALDEIKERLADGRDKLTQIKGEHAQANTDLTCARDKVRAEERRVVDAREEVAHLRQSVDFLTQRLAVMREEEAKLNAEIGRLNSTIHSQNKNIEDLGQVEIEHKKAISEQDKLIDKLQQEIRSRREVIEGLAHGEKVRRDELAHLANQVEEKKRQLAGAEIRMEEFENRTAQLQARSLEIENRNETVRGEFATLQLQIGEKTAEVADLVEKRERLAAEVRVTQATRADLAKNVEELNLRNEKLLQSCDATEARKQKIDAHCERATLQLAELHTQEKHQQEILKRMSAQVSLFEEKLLTARDVNADLEMKSKVLKEDIDRRQNTIRELEKNHQESIKKLESERSAILAIVDEKITLTREIERLQNKQHALVQDCQRLEARVREESEKTSFLDGEIRSRREILHEIDLEKSLRRSESETLNNRIHGLRNEEKDLIGRKNTLDTLLVSLQEQITQSEKVVADVATRIENERKRHIEETEKAQAASERASRNRAYLEETSQQLQSLYSDRDKVQTELLELRRQTLEKAEELSELETLRQDKLLRIEELTKEIHSMRHQRDSEETARLEQPDVLSRKRLGAIKESLLKLQTEMDATFTPGTSHKKVS